MNGKTSALNFISNAAGFFDNVNKFKCVGIGVMTVCFRVLHFILYENAVICSLVNTVRCISISSKWHS